MLFPDVMTCVTTRLSSQRDPQRFPSKRDLRNKVVMIDVNATVQRTYQESLYIERLQLSIKYERCDVWGSIELTTSTNRATEWKRVNS